MKLYGTSKAWMGPNIVLYELQKPNLSNQNKTYPGGLYLRGFISLRRMLIALMSQFVLCHFLDHLQRSDIRDSPRLSRYENFKLFNLQGSFLFCGVLFFGHFFAVVAVLHILGMFIMAGSHKIRNTYFFT